VKRSWALFLIVAAAVMDGILAGGGVDRALIALPAWRIVGPMGWAAFSQHADLGNGRLWYPLWALGGMICSVGAAIILYRDSRATSATRAPVYAAAVFMVGGLLITLKAAPIMMSINRLGNDPVALQHAFDGFAFWSYIRLGSQFLGWLANLWSLVALGSMMNRGGERSA